MPAVEAEVASALSHLECGWCGAEWPADRLSNLCPDCARPLLARYDMEQAARTLVPVALEGRPPNLWRYAEMLPVRQPALRKTLGEGYTPLLTLPRMGEELGMRRLYAKDESLNPTNSFKARGLAVAVNRAAELGARAIAIPDSLPDEQAAGFALVYGTSQLALEHRARLQAGETLLVLGAAGGVGLTAVELGAAMGARVSAAASSAEKLALARQYGAEAGINYQDEDLRERVLALTDGRGADVIFDPVGGDMFDAAARCIAWEGRYLVVGFASGRIPSLPANRALLKNMALVGVFWGAYFQRDPQIVRGGLATLLQRQAAGQLRPHISRVYPLAEAAAALNDLAERRARGKIILRTTD